MKVNAVMLTEVIYTSISTRINLITKISTNKVSAINDTIKKSYL